MQTGARGTGPAPRLSLKIACMNARLLLSAAAAPFLLIPAATQAQDNGDAVVIDEDRTTPVRTSTADNGQPADVEINGDITLDDAGPAVAIDSDNSVDLDGALLIEDQNGAVGVLLQGGNTGDLNVGGSISVTETYEAENTDDDTDNDGPFAQGENRVGILVEGPEAFEGDVNLEAGGSVQVEGNNSAGLRVASMLDGDVVQNGTVRTIGDNTRAIDIAGPVTGDVDLNSAISSLGENSSSVVVTGDVDGTLSIAGSVRSTGFRNTGAFGERLANLDEDDLLRAGPTVLIGASLGEGLVMDSSGSNILAQGNLYAILVTAENADGDLVIGGWPGADGSDDDEEIDDDPANGYGVVNRGTIAAQSVYEDPFGDGFDSVAMRIEGADSATTTVEKGIYNSGTIEAEAIEARAGGIEIGNGAAIPLIDNDGRIRTVAGTENGGLSQAIYVEDGAQLEAIENNGQITAGLIGEDGVALAIQDDSGTLRLIRNTNVISATFSESLNPDNDETTPPGEFETVAIDLSSATDSVIIEQLLLTAPPDEDDVDDDGDTEEPDPDFEAPDPSIIGDIRLGSAGDTVDIQAGSVDGNIDFGGGDDLLQIDNGGEVAGAVTNAEGLSIRVGEGVLQLENAGVVTVRDARFGDGSEFRILFSGDTIAKLEAAGVVEFEDGAAIAPRLDSLIGDGGSFEIVSAQQLQIEGPLEELNQENGSYLYNSSLEVSDADPNTLVLTLDRKSAQELGLNANEAEAYESAFAALSTQSDISRAFANIDNQEDFLDAYQQLLPDFSGAALQFVVNSVDGATGAVGNRLDVARFSREDGDRGVWAQEFGVFTDRETPSVGGGYRGHGFGFAAGADRPWGPFYAAGVNVVVSTNEIEQISGFDEPLQSKSFGAGLYAGGARGNLTYDIYVGGGVNWFDSERHVVVGVIDEQTLADWVGYHYNGSARLGYDMDLGWAMLRPLVSLDYLALNEEGYEEEGAGAIDLIVEDRSADVLSASATLALARRFGDDDSWWAPQLKFGVRNEFGGSLATTEASFSGIGAPFLLTPEDLPSTGGLVGFLITGGTRYSAFGFDYDADIRDGFTRHSARVVVRLIF